MNKIIKNIPAWVLSSVTIALILYASLDTNPFDAQHIRLFEGADKVVHCVMYFTLSVALIFDWAKQRYPHEINAKGVILCALIAFVFSVIMELMQGAMGLGRSASVADAIANFIGALSGFLFMKFVFLQRFYRIMR